MLVLICDFVLPSVNSVRLVSLIMIVFLISAGQENQEGWHCREIWYVPIPFPFSLWLLSFNIYSVYPLFESDMLVPHNFWGFWNSYLASALLYCSIIRLKLRIAVIWHIVHNIAGTRYGASLRKQIKKMEVSQHSKYFCEFCGKVYCSELAFIFTSILGQLSPPYGLNVLLLCSTQWRGRPLASGDARIVAKWRQAVPTHWSMAIFECYFILL